MIHTLYTILACLLLFFHGVHLKYVGYGYSNFWI